MSLKDIGVGSPPQMSEQVPYISPILFVQLRNANAIGSGKMWKHLQEALKVPAEACAAALGQKLSMLALNLQDLQRFVPAFDVLSFVESSRRLCLLLRATEALQAASAPSRRLCVALTDPFDVKLQSWLEQRVDGHVEWAIIHPEILQAFLSQQEGRMRALESAVADVGSREAADEIRAEHLSLTSIANNTSPVVRLVNSTILDAMKTQASDIHIETSSTGLQIKYRVDGVLSHAAQVTGKETASQVVSRVKVMAELDIAEQRVPQDGRFKLAIQDRHIDFRVSVMPSLFGEDVVIRILDKRSLTDQMQGLRLDRLGFEGKALMQLRKLANEPYGMLLVTGPTGSGKTTTLYAALTEINSGDVKIVTIEDPIEYELPGILQIPVNEKKGLTFARGLRSVLRHDPDKIFVGEIRDSETAQIAIQSALTGHLVFTSVHANNVFDVLGRFLHLGVDTYSFVSALNGVVAQRLLRVICELCKQPYELSEQQRDALGLNHAAVLDAKFFRGIGCAHCRGTGFKGRRAICEMLLMDDELRELIIARAPIRLLKEKAREKGTLFLRDAAVAAALAGWTTLDEVDRVTFAS